MKIGQKMILRAVLLAILVLGLLPKAGVLAQERQYGQEQFPRFLQAQKVVILSMAVDGVIAELPREPQNMVRKGDLLLRLDPMRLELEVKSYQAQIELNRSVSVSESQIRFKYAQDNLEIVQKLYNTMIGGTRAASEKELKEAKQSRDVYDLEKKKVEFEYRILGLRLRQNEQVLSQHSLLAPMDGVVVPFSSVKNLEARNLKCMEVGETVQASLPVMAMMKVDRLRVRQDLAKSRLNDVHLGQSARVFVDGAGNEAIPATIVYKSPTIVPAVGTFNIEVEFDNPMMEQVDQLPQGSYPYRFRPGMRARVELK